MVVSDYVGTTGLAGVTTLNAIVVESGLNSNSKPTINKPNNINAVSISQSQNLSSPVQLKSGNGHQNHEIVDNVVVIKMNRTTGR